MNRLQRIIDHKRAEIAMRRCERPEGLLREILQDLDSGPGDVPIGHGLVLTTGSHPDSQPGPAAARSLRAALERSHPAVIAEFKRRSPSAGMISNGDADAAAVAAGYARAGASAISVLTDEQFFGGTLADLLAVRAAVDVPLLRKDFILEEYQLIEARIAGADAVLLIAECLDTAELAALYDTAYRMGLEVLLEIHDAEQLLKLPSGVGMVGINHRDLRDFTVDIRRGPALLDRLRRAFPQALAVAESGVENESDAAMLVSAGFDALLIGSQFMRESDPGAACERMVNALRVVRDSKMERSFKNRESAQSGDRSQNQRQP